MVRLDLELGETLAGDDLLVSICHGEVVRGGLGRCETGFEVGIEVMRIDEIACGSRVYHSVCRDPSAASPYFQFYDDVYVRMVPTMLGVGDKTMLGCQC